VVKDRVGLLYTQFLHPVSAPGFLFIQTGPPSHDGDYQKGAPFRHSAFSRSFRIPLDAEQERGVTMPVAGPAVESPMGTLVLRTASIARIWVCFI
jgi:hypothetical protein